MPEKINLIDKSYTEVKNFLTGLNQPSFRADQLFNWIYGKNISDFNLMRNIPSSLRDKLSERAVISLPLKVKEKISEDGSKKFLFRLKDGELIESVYIPSSRGRKTLCLSTQAGCAMKCAFCATALPGLKRSLSCGEIIGQILKVQEITRCRITNPVLMGMGEPLANYSSVLKAVYLMGNEKGLNISMRKISLSTCGLAEQIKKLAGEKLQITLAVSLNAPADSLRKHLMPVNNNNPLSSLMSACRLYAEKTGRRISFEYVLIKGVNDSPVRAAQLAELLKNTLSHVNLISFNPVPGLDFQKPPASSIKIFKEKLEKYNIPVSVRKERGGDIQAACGQLKAASPGEI